MTISNNAVDVVGQYMPDTYDEINAGGATARDSWAHLLESLETLGAPEIERRRREASNLLRYDGATYNVYGDPSGLHRPWPLDPIPLLMGSDEWSDVEAGLTQRAELLNLVLEDLYGPRELIRSGLLPIEIVATHPGFLRSCTGISMPGEHQLIFYAADLARGPNGRMWVIGDRTQAPSGVGYALENRTVMARVFPSLYRDTQVHSLGLFFRTLRTTLDNLAPPSADEPRIVVLTPGPLNETYFEQAYLASYLGYTLVEGDDLTVRDGRVYLRSLAGLERVDVIVRRVDDTYCDPLELRGDSHLGVAGLVEAARRGNVTVVNGLGAGILENPGLMPFLPRIAKKLLGQKLRLPSVATWWCGQRAERDFVLDNLSDLVIRRIHRRAGVRPVFGRELDSSELDEWRRRITAEPNMWVGQEHVSFSHAPAFVDGGLRPHQTVLRAFLTARDDSYIVMPGGLTRTAPQGQTGLLSNQAGGISKDTWVLSSEPEKRVSIWSRSGRIQGAVDMSDLLTSRAAENLFWVGRYAERAEATIRLLRTVLAGMTEPNGAGNGTSAAVLATLFETVTHLTCTYPGFTAGDDLVEDPTDELISVISDDDRTGSLVSSLHGLVNAAHAVRGLMSTDTWQVVNDIDDEIAAMRAEGPSDLPAAGILLARAVRSLLALSGLSNESMVREPGWRFLDTGRRVERAHLLIALCDSTLISCRTEQVEQLLYESVLRAAESVVIYRRRYRSQMAVETVLELLLLDNTNPRSLIYQLDRIVENLAELPRTRGPAQLNPEERVALDTRTRAQLAEIPPLAECVEATHARVGLASFLSDIGAGVLGVSDALTERYFTHLPATQLKDVTKEEVSH